MNWTKQEFSFHDTQRLLFKLAERVKAFNGLTTNEISELMESAEKCIYQPGQSIVSEGSVGMFMYIIIDGEAVVTKKGRSGDAELATLGPTDSFGEMALADRESRSATVTAKSECTLIRLSEKAIDTQPSIGLKVFRNICRVLSERLRNADEQLVWRL